jgi:hypothetical protein
VFSFFICVFLGFLFAFSYFAMHYAVAEPASHSSSSQAQSLYATMMGEDPVRREDVNDAASDQAHYQQIQVAYHDTAAGVDEPPLVFVHVSQGHGDAMDEMIRKHGLRGVILEGIPELAAALDTQYEDLWPDVTVENARICENTGMRALDRDSLTELSARIAAASKVGYMASSALKQVIGIDPEAPHPEVRCTTLRHVVDKHRLQYWDYLHVREDDCNLLNFADFGVRPRHISITCGLALDEKCANRLAAQGYMYLRRDGIDVIYRRGTDDK